MPAYMMIACKITDREKFKDGYGKEAAGLVAKMGGKYLALCPTGTLLRAHEGYTLARCQSGRTAKPRRPSGIRRNMPKSRNSAKASQKWKFFSWMGWSSRPQLSHSGPRP